MHAAGQVRAHRALEKGLEKRKALNRVVGKESTMGQRQKAMRILGEMSADQGGAQSFCS